MEVKSAVQHADKSVEFVGTVTDKELAIIMGFGLNALFAMGLMAQFPDLTANIHTDETLQ